MKIIKKWILLKQPIDEHEYQRLLRLSNKVEIINDKKDISSLGKNSTFIVSKKIHITTTSENQELLLKILYDNKLILLEEYNDYWNY